MAGEPRLTDANALRVILENGIKSLGGVDRYDLAHALDDLVHLAEVATPSTPGLDVEPPRAWDTNEHADFGATWPNNVSEHERYDSRGAATGGGSVVTGLPGAARRPDLREAARAVDEAWWESEGGHTRRGDFYIRLVALRAALTSTEGEPSPDPLAVPETLPARPARSAWRGRKATEGKSAWRGR